MNQFKTIFAALIAAQKMNSFGTSLIEMSFCIPLFLLLMLGGSDIAHILRVHHETSILARTVADDIFQSCRNASNRGACIQGNIQNITQRVSEVSPTSHVVVGFYPCEMASFECHDSQNPAQNCSPLSANCNCVCGALGVPVVFGEQNQYATRFDQGTIFDQYRTVFDNQAWMATTEIYSDYSLFSGLFNSINVAYEATIY